MIEERKYWKNINNFIYFIDLSIYRMNYTRVKNEIEDFKGVKEIFDKFREIKKELGIPQSKFVDIKGMRNNLEKMHLIK